MTSKYQGARSYLFYVHCADISHHCILRSLGGIPFSDLYGDTFFNAACIEWLTQERKLQAAGIFSTSKWSSLAYLRIPSHIS